MGGRETGWYRTESGVVLEMDHPLPGGIAHRVRNGEIVRVANAAGDPWEAPADLSTPSTEDAVTLAETRAELAKALDLIAELEAERDKLADDLEQAKTPSPTKATKAAAKADDAKK